jgi:hypothetical protein
LVPSNLINWSFLVIRLPVAGFGLVADLVIFVPSEDQRRYSAATEQSPDEAGGACEWVMACGQYRSVGRRSPVKLEYIQKMTVASRVQRKGGRAANFVEKLLLDRMPIR